MARVRMFGTVFTATPLFEMEGGWMMEARQHTARTAPGTNFFAHTNEILEMAAAEKPADDGAAALDAAMAAERATLPTFKEIDAARRAKGA